jgi:hypothetical protein
VNPIAGDECPSEFFLRKVGHIFLRDFILDNGLDEDGGGIMSRLAVVRF